MNENLKNKAGDWFLKKYEDRLKYFIVPRLPLWLQTNHLTWMTVFWSLSVIVIFYWGKTNSSALHFVSLFVVLQYLTDLLDGELGRHRNTGLIKWGYYADHFLDFVFMSSILFGYGIVIGFNIWLFIMQAILSGFMVHTFLLVSASQEFKISLLNVGPTEGRVLYIVLHSIIVLLGTEKLNVFLPVIVSFCVLLLGITFLITQKKLRKQDLPYLF